MSQIQIKVDTLKTVGERIAVAIAAILLVYIVGLTVNFVLYPLWANSITNVRPIEIKSESIESAVEYTIKSNPPLLGDFYPWLDRNIVIIQLEYQSEGRKIEYVTKESDGSYKIYESFSRRKVIRTIEEYQQVEPLKTLLGE